MPVRRVLLGGGGSAPVNLALERIGFDLVGRYGANAVAETAVAGRTDWTNDANATGVRNGSSAGFAGDALGARGGQLELDYADPVGKDSLVISSARLLFYVQVAGTLLDNADVQLRYAIGGGAFVTAATITGDVNALTVPRVVDLTALATSWPLVASVRAAVRADAGLGETWTAALDAVELEVIASRVVTTGL